MRSFRQIFYGCRKHRYRLVRQIRWYEDEYRDGMRSKWICVNCHQIINMSTVVKYKWMFD